MGAQDEPHADQPRGASGLPRARRIGGGRRVLAGSAVAPNPAEVVWHAPGEEPQTPAPAEPVSRAGRNLPAAVGVGLGLGALIIATLFLYRPSFAVLVGVVVAYGTFELSRAIAKSGTRITVVPVVVGGLAALAAAWTRGPDGLVLAILLTACGVLIWRIGDGAEGYLRDVSASLLVLLYLPGLAGFAVLSASAHDGAARILAFAVTVVCSDTGGYATGVLFGRHPLAPIVSKAKTWEGFAGSMLFCCASGVLFLTLTFHEAWWTGLLFGAGICVVATLGDLGESLIKRDLDVKDMGTLLPGHGGLMDRLDSMLPCAAVGYLLLAAFTSR